MSDFTEWWEANEVTIFKQDQTRKQIAELAWICAKQSAEDEKEWWRLCYLDAKERWGRAEADERVYLNNMVSWFKKSEQLQAELADAKHELNLHIERLETELAEYKKKEQEEKERWEYLLGGDENDE